MSTSDPTPDPTPTLGLDAVLDAVVRTGARRRTARRVRLAGAGVGVLAVVSIGAAVALPIGGRRTAQEIAAPVTTTTTGPAASTTTGAPPVVVGPRLSPNFVQRLIHSLNEQDFLRRVKAEALNEVTPYGLPEASRRVGGVAFDTFAVSGSESAAGGATPSTMAAASPQAGGVKSPPPSAPPSGGTARQGGTDSSSQASTGAVAPAVSGTNNQEVGVDEPDVTKTDGHLLVRVRGSQVSVVVLGTGAPTAGGTLGLPANTYATDALLTGTRAVVMGQVSDGRSSQGQLVVIELADPAHPRLVATRPLGGTIVSSRLVAGTVELVTASRPSIEFAYPDGTPTGEGAALTENKRRVQASKISDWLDPATGCTSAFHTDTPSGLAVLGVRTFDPATATLGAGECIVSAAETVYSTPDHLYVATAQFDAAAAQSTTVQTTIPGPSRGPRATSSPMPVPDAVTSIHRFDLPKGGASAVAYRGSGSVAGRVLNQYSLSEQADLLRVASTRQSSSSGDQTGVPATDAQVAVMRLDARDLVTVGRLKGLGKGERITGVRFVGDLGYVVTAADSARPNQFCDPLFVVDLTDPTKPAARGALEIPGVTSYLHPVTAATVLGVGVDAPKGQSARCQRSAPQVSVFDVSNPDAPKLASRVNLELGSSAATADPHAFLYWAPTSLVAIPLQTSTFSGAVVMRVTGTTINEVRRISLPKVTEQGKGNQGGPAYAYQPVVDRLYVVGSQLLAVADTGVGAFDLTTLASLGYTAFDPGTTTGPR